MSELDFRKLVMDMASWCGWMVYYVPDSRRCQGDAGYPDLTLARGGTVLHVELKRDGRSPTKAQRKWMAALGSSAAVWRPGDWDAIRETLA